MLPESGDSAAIKLFGRKIPLNPLDATAFFGEEFEGGKDDKIHESPESKNSSNSSSNKDHESPDADNKSSPLTSSTASNTTLKSSPTQAKNNAPETEKVDPAEKEKDTNNSEEKPTKKKPDKILPCPRCNSLDTKFCYFNNYNVNQPRHFCKHCQRYWTAGGAMRNVPVGAGRRRSKHSLKQLAISNAPSQTLQSNSPLQPNGTILSFGPDPPLCESMASVLDLAEKNNKIGVHQTENSRGKCQGFTGQVPCFNSVQWPCPWSPVAIPVYPASAYWSCAIPGTWNIPWLATPFAAASSSSPTGASSSGSGSNSPTLGKHSRDGQVLINGSNSDKEETHRKSDPGKCLWMPKTLRLDDPEEAAKISVWTALGVKNKKVDGTHGGLFNAFHSKLGIKNHRAEPSPTLCANPAALSRSLDFHESS